MKADALQDKNARAIKAKITLERPKGSKNLASYIKNLQTRQHVADVHYKKVQQEVKAHENEINSIDLVDPDEDFDDPRTFSDVLKENADLKE